MTPQLVLAASPAPPAHTGGMGSGYKWSWRLKGSEQTSPIRSPSAEVADTMRTLSLLTLLALAAFCLSGPADAKPSGSESDRAFVSKQEGSKVVSRPRRYLNNGLGAPAPYPDPLEPKREVCELNPDCDELAEQIGLQNAYSRYYGTTP
ncbi:osteocalcin isoform X2 [Mesocricetus auratus]|uniref:Osteocalcin n=1 Tax=Mesocricetus auratus TaxID=10036 RepID=A0A1U7QJP0_MESAU|nr:osteocalcin isoform X2 [Mesocricetus auratus]